MRMFFLSLVTLITFIDPAVVYAYDPGDTVLLVERELHIPAHPAPRDSSVPFRFVGGSLALVLRIDSPSGWLELRGERLGGGEATGWITKRYIERVVEGDTNGALPPEIAWVPRKRLGGSTS